MYFSAKVWRILFFVGVVLLNAMVPFRKGALKAGGWQQFGWSGGVVTIGAFLLYSLWQLRLHRQAKHATAPTPAASTDEDLSPDTSQDTDEAAVTKEAPKAFVPPSRHKALAHTRKAQKKKKKKKRKKK